MKKLSINFLLTSFWLLALTVSIDHAQPPDTLWTRTFGGSSFEEGQSVRQTTDGGYVIAGSTFSYGMGSEDVFLIKTDSMGYRQWAHTFGGDSADEGWSVQQTRDGGYIITGLTRSHIAHHTDCLLIKTNVIGELQWYRTFGGTDSDAGLSVQQCIDGGYIITGYSDWYGPNDGDILLIKTDSSGHQQWNRIFGGRETDVGWGVQQTTDGGYIIVGKTQSYGAGNNKVWLIKTDSTGHQQWNRIFGGHRADFGSGVQQTADGGYIIIGTAYCVLGDDVQLIKTDSLGNRQWERTYGVDGEEDWGASVQQTTDGGYIIAGTSLGLAILLIKTDCTGTKLWSRTFGGSNFDYGRSVRQTTDGGYIIAGTTGSYGAGGTDVWLIRVAAEASSVIDPSQHQPSEFAFFPPYPNPFNATTTLNFSLPRTSDVSMIIYNVEGRKVTVAGNGFYPAGLNRVVFDASDLSSGIYFIQLKTQDFTQTQKMVVLK
jgi:hypothetical protein